MCESFCNTFNSMLKIFKSRWGVMLKWRSKCIMLKIKKNWCILFTNLDLLVIQGKVAILVCYAHRDLDVVVVLGVTGWQHCACFWDVTVVEHHWIILPPLQGRKMKELMTKGFDTNDTHWPYKYSKTVLIAHTLPCLAINIPDTVSFSCRTQHQLRSTEI